MTLPFVDADTDVQVSHKDQMNPNLLIREAQSSEYETVANLTMAAYRPLFTELDLPEDLGWYGAELRDVAGRAARSEIIVAVTGEQIVGSLAYHDDYSDETSLVIPGIVRDFEFWRQILSCKVVALEKP